MYTLKVDQNKWTKISGDQNKWTVFLRIRPAAGHGKILLRERRHCTRDECEPRTYFVEFSFRACPEPVMAIELNHDFPDQEPGATKQNEGTSLLFSAT
jgi:hypothetical protein